MLTLQLPVMPREKIQHIPSLCALLVLLFPVMPHEKKCQHFPSYCSILSAYSMLNAYSSISSDAIWVADSTFPILLFNVYSSVTSQACQDFIPLCSVISSPAAWEAVTASVIPLFNARSSISIHATWEADSTMLTTFSIPLCDARSSISSDAAWEADLSFSRHFTIFKREALQSRCHSKVIIIEDRNREEAWKGMRNSLIRRRG